MDWTTADIPPQYHRCALITGVGGLAFEAGLAMARAGADVILAGRNPAKAAESIGRIRSAYPAANIRFELLDLASLASVAACSDRLLAARQPLGLLLNNAGVMSPPQRRETADGFELQFGTNYLGHFALTMRLMPLLLLAAAPRVVSVSSVIHRQGRIDFDNLQAEHRYNPRKAYAQSKLAMLMFAFELDRRAKAAGSPLASIGAHPGVARTELFSSGPGNGPIARFARLLLPLVSHSAADGALPLLFAGTSPQAISGGYYGPNRFFEMKGRPQASSVASQARDLAVAQRLWETSCALTGTNWSASPLE